MDEDEAAVLEGLAEELAEETGLTVSECLQELRADLGSQALLVQHQPAEPAEDSAITEAERQLQNPELYPPIVVNQALLDDVDGAEDVAMALLRRRYTESVAQRRLAELPEPEHEPEATAAAVDPLVARGLGIGEEPGPDDWLFLERRVEARRRLPSDVERAQLDEAVYAAARDGDRAALESLLGRGATSVLRRLTHWRTDIDCRPE